MPKPSNETLLAGVKEHIEGRAYLSTGSLVSDAETIVRNSVSRGLSAGRSNDAIVQDTYAQLVKAGFLSKDDMAEATGLGAEALAELLGDTEAMNLARLDTIVRTNVFEAFNEARYDYFVDPELNGFVEAFEYSSILDDNTTEICEELNGFTRSTDDDIWNTHSPPNHYNCRSVLIPIIVGDGWKPSPDPSVEPQKGFK